MFLLKLILFSTCLTFALCQFRLASLPNRGQSGFRTTKEPNIKSPNTITRIQVGPTVTFKNESISSLLTSSQPKSLSTPPSVQASTLAKRSATVSSFNDLNQSNSNSQSGSLNSQSSRDKINESINQPGNLNIQPDDSNNQPDDLNSQPNRAKINESINQPGDLNSQSSRDKINESIDKPNESSNRDKLTSESNDANKFNESSELRKPDVSNDLNESGNRTPRFETRPSAFGGFGDFGASLKPKFPTGLQSFGDKLKPNFPSVNKVIKPTFPTFGDNVKPNLPVEIPKKASDFGRLANETANKFKNLPIISDILNIPSYFKVNSLQGAIDYMTKYGHLEDTVISSISSIFFIIMYLPENYTYFSVLSLAHTD